MQFLRGYNRDNGSTYRLSSWKDYTELDTWSNVANDRPTSLPPAVSIGKNFPILWTEFVFLQKSYDGDLVPIPSPHPTVFGERASKEVMRLNEDGTLIQ